MANRFLSNIRINDAYTFPASDGTNGQVIKTDGSGNLTFGQLSADSASVMYKDTFTGDGTTTGFTLANALNDEVQSNIYIDGVYQSKSTYSVSGTTITFSTAPLSGHEIEVISTTGINSGPTAIFTDTFTANGSATAFTLGQTVHSENQTIVFLNGVYQFKGTYTLSGTTLTLDTAPANGVSIEVMSIGSAYSGGDILYDHDFTSAGLMTSNGSGVYSITANNSANWNTAYGWGDHSTQSYATQSYVGTQISNLVDSSPATLDTLNELAAALGDDPNFATTTATSIGLKAPLASPSFTGNATFAGNITLGRNIDLSSSDYTYIQGTHTGASDGEYVMRTFGYGDSTFYGSFDILRHDTDDGELRLRQRIAGTATDVLSIVDGNSTFEGTVTCSGGAGNNNDSANALIVNSTEHVRAIVDTSSTSGHRASYILESNGNEVGIETTGSSEMIFQSGGSEKMRIDSSGNIGIGITPNVNSSVVNVIQLGKGMTLMGNANDDRATMAANLYLDTGTAFRYVMDGLAGRFSIEDGQMVWGTGGSGTAGAVATVNTKMTLLNNGNLGIGTTSPTSKLHLRDPGTNSDVGIKIGNDSRDWNLKVMGSASDSFQIFTHDNSNVMTILPSGNSTFAGTVKTQNTSANAYPYFSIQASAKEYHIGVGGASGVAGYANNLYFYDNTEAAIRMLIDTNGNVGIGTDSPTAPLEIQANYTANGGYTNSNWAKYLVFDAENTGGGGIIWKKQSSAYNRAIVNNQGRMDFGRSTANNHSAAWLSDFSIDAVGDSTFGGNIFIASTSDGIFLGGTSTANKLNDYEEGTWTPTIKDLSGNLATLSHASGTYTKIGRQVILNYRVVLSSKGSMTGNYVLMGGIPFNHPVATNGTGTVDYFYNLDIAYSSLHWDTTSTASVCWLVGVGGSGSGSTYYVTPSAFGGDETLKGSIIYTVS